MTTQPEVALAEPIRRRVVALAAAALGSMTVTEVPVALRRIARFAPSRRATTGGAAIAEALARDPAFRVRVGEHAAASSPEPAALVRSGAAVPESDPVELGALAYLLRPPDWPDLVKASNEVLARRRAEAEDAGQAMVVDRLTEQLHAVRTATREELAGLRAEVETLKAENSRIRQRLGQSRAETRSAVEAVARADALAEELRTGSAASAAADTEIRRLRQRLAETEAALEAARRSARDARLTETIRTKVLLESVLDAARGLQNELALPALVTRPADLVVAAEPEATGPAHRGRDADDPELLEQMLEVPHVHLIVDGYNVTKLGYGELTLEDQRTRLLTALGSLASRHTKAELTCVFDGAEVVGGALAVPLPRRVRLRFSAAGTSADDLIRDLVAAEPPGRRVVVVTNDLEIIRDVRRSDAWPVGSAALLRLLSAR